MRYLGDAAGSENVKRTLVHSSLFQSWRAGTLCYISAAVILALISPDLGNDWIAFYVALGGLAIGFARSVAWALYMGRNAIVETDDGIGASQSSRIIWSVRWDRVDRIIWNTGRTFPSNNIIRSFPLVEVMTKIDDVPTTCRIEMLLFGSSQRRFIETLTSTCASHGVRIEIDSMPRRRRFPRTRF